MKLVLPIIDLPAHAQGFVPRDEPEADDLRPVAPATPRLPGPVVVINTPSGPPPRPERAFIP